MKPSLALSCPINDLSYGIVSKNILEELSSRVEVSLFPIGQIEGREYSKLVLSSIENSYSGNLKPDSTSLRIFHQFDLSHHIGKGKHIGFPFFELDMFNGKEVSNLNRQDLVLATSEWAKGVIKSQCDVDVAVVPLGIDPLIFYPQPNKNPNKCIFLNIGKFEKRKGHDILAKAAGIVFEGKDDVQLWMMADNPFLNDNASGNWVSLYRRELGNKVVFVPKQPSHHATAQVINQSNVGVFPYRAEGWCLPLLECMACGLDIIATNYSAPTEYLTTDNSSLLYPISLETAQDGVFFNGVNGSWASLEGDYLDQLVHSMELEYKRWKDFGPGLNESGIETAKEYTWSHTAERILEYV